MSDETKVEQGGPDITTPAPETKSNEVSLPAEKISILNIDEIRPNSVLIINIDVESPEEKMAVAPVFSRLLAPYTPLLREKRVTVMLMTSNENINVINEEDMNAAGWFKKEKSLIINPYDKR